MQRQVVIGGFIQCTYTNPSVFSYIPNRSDSIYKTPTLLHHYHHLALSQIQTQLTNQIKGSFFFPFYRVFLFFFFYWVFFKMASKVIASTSLLMSLNLLFFTLVSSNHVLCPQPRENPRRFLHNSPATPTCSVDTLKLGVCAGLLNGLVHLGVGTLANTPCCSLLDNLVDLEAAVCLCMIIKANILGINLSDPVALSLLLNYCGKNVPSGFQCA